MKIILLQDEKKLGKKGDIVEVSEGYARNFILPKKIGMEANARNMNDLKLQKASQEKKAREQMEAAQALALQIGDKTVTVSMKAGENGKTFGSISTKEIAAALKDQHGIEVDKKKIVLPEPIKTFGTFEVAVKLHPQVAGTIRVKVEEA
ncbi:MAG: 50S ribosomal protein L9 [Lachnospiraceae bacterium]|nr:50S ribosomal protein L9 [Lachnospiraceae bacterium]